MVDRSDRESDVNQFQEINLAARRLEMKRIITGMLVVVSLGLTGCGGGSGSGPTSSTVSGTVSQGAALPAGTVVTLKDAKGVAKTTSITGDGGSYRIVVDGLTAPYVLHAGGYYSLAPSPGITNINPLTHLSMQLALGSPTISDTTVIPANLQTLLTAVVTDLKAKTNLLYPVLITDTQKDYLNGNITIDAGVDKILSLLTITPPDASGNFSVSVGGQQILSGTRSNGVAIISADAAAISSVKNAIFQPSVTGMNPAAGKPGTTVTITGTNFSGNTAGNTVKFNRILATVTAASPTSLTVTVPAGAITGAISVTTAGMTANSADSFNVDTGVYPCPSIWWEFAPSPVGTTYIMEICYTGSGVDCSAISGSYFVLPGDVDNADLAYAQSVATEYNNMIGRLWSAKSYPLPSTLESVFRSATNKAVSNQAHTAVQDALAGFTAAGFPAAGTGGAGGTGTLASCSDVVYPGDTSSPQIYIFDAIAQFDACALAATKDEKYRSDGNMQCQVLAGTNAATGNNFTPLFCSGSVMK